MRLFILLMLFSGAVQAKAYKCEDANGFTVYQQKKCNGDTKSSTIQTYKEPQSAIDARKKKSDARTNSELLNKYNSRVAYYQQMRARKQNDNKMGVYISDEAYDSVLRRTLTEIDVMKEELRIRGIGYNEYQ